MKLRTLSTSVRRIIVPLGMIWLSPICYAVDSSDVGMADEKYVGVVLLKAASLRNSGNSLEAWYKLKTEQLTGKFNKALIDHPDASLVVLPEYSLYRYGRTFRIDQAYDSVVNLDRTGDGYYVIDTEDSYEPLVNAINAIQDLAKQHRVNVVLNTVPQKVYPDRILYASLPQSMVTNSALIIDPDGRIKDVDMKVSESFDSNDYPQTEFAMESKNLRYFKTKDGHTISYINLICAEKYNQDLKKKLAGLNADIITYGEYEGDGIMLHSPVETYGIVQSGGYWLGTDSAKGSAGVLGFDGAKTLLSNKQEADYVYADIPIQDSPIFGERDKTTLTHEKKTIKMKHRYNKPVVIANLPTRNGRQSAVVYVSDVQSDQFTIQLVESPELDGQHTEEEVSYLVLESGVWRFPSGQVIQVGTMEIDEIVNNSLGKDSIWSYGNLILADFSHDSRVVFTQVQGGKNISEYISTREMRPIDESYWNFNLALERAEGVDEKAEKRNVGYVIASPGQSGKDTGQALQIGLTEKEISSQPSAISLAVDLFQSTPHVFANIASYAGSDSAHLRKISSSSDSNDLYLMVEEDGHNDSEMRHAAERVSYLAIEGDGLMRLRDDFSENKQSNGSMDGGIANDPLMNLQSAAYRQDKTATENNEDTTPNSFHFLDLNNIPLGINVQNGITVSGINTRTPISVKGGKYSINGGSLTKTQGWVESGDRVHAHHTTSREGGKTVSTTVTIGGVSSAFKTTTKGTSNKLPVALAGADKSVTQGTRVKLNGSGSSDSDGSIKRYVWKEGIKTLSTHKKFSKIFDVGTHNITLKVIDDKGAKSRDKVRITVKEKIKQNKLPVAMAGADKSVKQGARVTLNGSSSSDSDGSIKRYVWKEEDKKLSTNKKFSNIFGVGMHNITLEVEDDKGAKSSDKVKITVKKAASTVGEDRSPDAFELMSRADRSGSYSVIHGSHVVSDTIIVRGINVPATS